VIGRRDYETRRAARVARLEAAADAKRSEAAQLRTKNDALLGVMNGTPVLIGHHSEGRHRRDLARIERDMRKGAQASRDAQELARRAVAAEKNQAISADDPEALVKLRAKVAALETQHVREKALNAVIRKHRGKDAEDMAAALVAVGVSAALASELVKPDFAGRVGIPDYVMSNRNAEIKRLKARIAQLESFSQAVPREETIGEVKIGVSDNRVQMYFDGKPPEALRAELKANGFRWAPSVGAWQRIANERAWETARRIAAKATGHAPEV
jgi:hypothetical protein